MSRGLGRVQKDILNLVCEYGGAKEFGTQVYFLYALTDAHKASVARAITSLEERGLVARGEDYRGRDVVKATSAGLIKWAAMAEQSTAI